MREVYRKTGADGELLAATVEVSYDELVELLKPHIAPDGFKVEYCDKGLNGLSIHFVRADSASGDRNV